jgi:hypothetical protein
MAPIWGVHSRLGGSSTPTVIPPRPASVATDNLSADGRRVFFETTDALVGADTNGNEECPPVGSDLQAFPACLDVYEWEAQGTGTCDAADAVADGGCLYLISTGQGTQPALLADVSGDGKDAFFFTRSRLVGQDEDALVDVYDARELGGLAAQNPPPPNPCLTLEVCHPAGPPTPEIPPAPKFVGPGNPKNKGPPCRKPKHKVKGRCVSKHGKKHKRRQAKSKRGSIPRVNQPPSRTAR